MKTNKYLCVLAALAMFTACNDLDPEDVNFNVVADKTEIKAGEEVTFHFDGNPNFITFFSGEDGHQYIYRDRTELDAADIESSTLSFEVQSQYGKQTNAFHVYLSKDFPGLTKKDADADRKTIQEHAWNDVTEACGLAGADGKPVTVAYFDLSDYQAGLTIAFRFTGTTETTPQRTITLKNIIIRNTLTNGSVTEVAGSTMDFSCFDINPSNKDNDCYKMVTTGSVIQGTWSLVNQSKNQFQFQGGNNSHATWANNDDWLIANSIKLNACTPDSGENIKDINRRVNSYSYIFTKPGTYTVTFLAGNATVEGRKIATKEIKITVK